MAVETSEIGTWVLIAVAVWVVWMVFQDVLIAVLVTVALNIVSRRTDREPR